MGSRKKASKKLSSKPIPEVTLKVMHVQQTDKGLEFIIPVARVTVISIIDEELPAIVYQKAGKKYWDRIDRTQAVPRGTKYVMLQYQFKKRFKEVHFRDEYHQEFFKEENAGRNFDSES